MASTVKFGSPRNENDLAITLIPHAGNQALIKRDHAMSTAESAKYHKLLSRHCADSLRRLLGIVTSDHCPVVKRALVLMADDAAIATSYTCILSS